MMERNFKAPDESVITARLAAMPARRLVRLDTDFVPFEVQTSSPSLIDHELDNIISQFRWFADRTTIFLDPPSGCGVLSAGGGATIGGIGNGRELVCRYSGPQEQRRRANRNAPEFDVIDFGSCIYTNCSGGTGPVTKGLDKGFGHQAQLQ